MTAPAFLRGREQRLLIGAIVLLALVAAIWLLPSRQWVIDGYYAVRRLDPREGFFVFVGLYTLLSAIGLPTSPLNIGAGLLFGLFLGFLASMAGVMAACIVCFIVARYLARGWVLRRLRHWRRFRVILKALRYESWRIILLARLNPVLPAAVASYAFGVTSIRFRNYLAASLIGNIPLCFVLAYLGAAGQMALGGRDHSPWSYVLTAVGLIATIALTVWLTRFTKRKLKEYETRAERRA